MLPCKKPKNKFMLCCLVKNQKTNLYVMLPCKKPKNKLYMLCVL